MAKTYQHHSGYHANPTPKGVSAELVSTRNRRGHQESATTLDFYGKEEAGAFLGGNFSKCSRGRAKEEELGVRPSVVAWKKQTGKKEFISLTSDSSRHLTVHLQSAVLGGVKFQVTGSGARSDLGKDRKAAFRPKKEGPNVRSFAGGEA